MSQHNDNDDVIEILDAPVPQRQGPSRIINAKIYDSTPSLPDMVGMLYSSWKRRAVMGADVSEQLAAAERIDSYTRVQLAKARAVQAEIECERAVTGYQTYPAEAMLESRRRIAELTRETLEMERDADLAKETAKLPLSRSRALMAEESDLARHTADRDGHRQRGRIARTSNLPQSGFPSFGAEPGIEVLVTADEIKSVALAAVVRNAQEPPSEAGFARERFCRDLKSRFHPATAEEIIQEYDAMVLLLQ